MIVVGATVIHKVDGINRRRGLLVTRCGQVWSLSGNPPGTVLPNGEWDEQWLKENGITTPDGGPPCLCCHCRDRWPRRKPGRHRSAYRGRK